MTTDINAAVDNILNRPYSFVVTREDDGRFSAKVAEFPGCVADGEDRQDALKNLEEVAREWVTAALEDGYTISAPPEQSAASGRFLVRLPKSVHARLQAEAAREEVSLNQYVVSVLSGQMGAVQVATQVASRVAEMVSPGFGFLGAFNLYAASGSVLGQSGIVVGQGSALVMAARYLPLGTGAQYGGQPVETPATVQITSVS